MNFSLQAVDPYKAARWVLVLVVAWIVYGFVDRSGIATEYMAPQVQTGKVGAPTGSLLVFGANLAVSVVVGLLLVNTGPGKAVTAALAGIIAQLINSQAPAPPPVNALHQQEASFPYPNPIDTAEERAFYSRKLADAAQAGDAAGVKMWSDLIHGKPITTGGKAKNG